MAGDITGEVAARLAGLAAGLRRRGQSAEVVGQALIGRVFACYADALGVPAAARVGVTSAGPGLESPEGDELAALPWIDVDPAIFGALVEGALGPDERRRLGAHFTPRAHVERLVAHAIAEPLRADWSKVQALAAAARERGDEDAARRLLCGFAAELAGVRVLDPACGTGNFLIVAYEWMKQLEREVRESIGCLDGHVPTVILKNFVGLDCKPWTCEIAGLALWVAAIRWHVRAYGAAPAGVVEERATIVEQDALLAGDAQAAWPAADFIVGNPPFLGKSRLRACLGAEYLQRLRAAYPEVPESADLVMYWWHRAGMLVQSGAVRRLGLVTTNSVAQIYNRRVIARFLAGEPPIHLTCAIADHPWIDGPGGAGVRIAMTVAAAGRGAGTSVQMSGDREASVERGTIGADLGVGVGVGGAARLAANQDLAGAGVMLGGRGFLVMPDDALLAGSNGVIRPIVHGRDLLQRARQACVIDFSGLAEDEARSLAPAAFERIAATVRPLRSSNPRASRRSRYWQFAETMPATRRAIAGLSRYIVTPETAKHRVFFFVDGAVIPEHPLLAIGLDDAFALGVLSSQIHGVWARATGGTLADRPRYNKSVCFETFPFPSCEPGRREAIAGLAEELEGCRKRLQGDGWTVTAMYNAGVPALRAIHERLDREVAAAYGFKNNGDAREVLAELLALNAARAAEERGGLVRRLR